MSASSSSFKSDSHRTSNISSSLRSSSPTRKAATEKLAVPDTFRTANSNSGGAMPKQVERASRRDTHLNVTSTIGRGRRIQPSRKQSSGREGDDVGENGDNDGGEDGDDGDQDNSDDSALDTQGEETDGEDNTPHPHADKIHLLRIFRAPMPTLKYFMYEVHEHFSAAVAWMMNNPSSMVLIFAVSLITIIAYVSPHQFGLKEEHFGDMLWFGWWIWLGVLSSVGLGSGLHTFVLYLAPYIVNVANYAYQCESLDFDSRGFDWEETFKCPDTSDGNVTIWGLATKVRVEALLWGVGTAIGELPPYFVARAYRLAGDHAAQLDGEHLAEIDEITKGTGQSYLDRAKRFVHNLVQRAGFFGILLAASIPNPLFDLAGITCGHFLIPFGVFFGATLIGKAVIKSQLQVFSVVLAANKEFLTRASIWLENSSFSDYGGTFISGKLKDFGKSAKLAHDNVPKTSLLSMAWDAILYLVLTYFIISIVESFAQSYIKRFEKRRMQRLEEKHKKKALRKGANHEISQYHSRKISAHNSKKQK